MKIIMNESYMEYRRYTLHITDEYLKVMTEWLRTHAKTPEAIPDITEKMVYNAINHISTGDIVYKFCYPNDHDDWSYETSLFAQISDYISEEMWEDDYDVLDGETDDVEFDIEDYDEEE